MQKIKEQAGSVYKGIDCMKFVMALLVIVLHTHPFYGINDTWNFITADVLGRLAVPFFFAATGFLLEKKIQKNQQEKLQEKQEEVQENQKQENQEKQKSQEQTRRLGQIVGRYVCRLLKLYLVWTAVYLPIIIYSKIICSERGVKYGIFATLRDFVFCGSYVHLWYLTAAAVGVVMVFFCLHRLGIGKTGVVLLLLFLAGLLTQSYFGILVAIFDENGMVWRLLQLVKKVMVTCRNGVFFGGLFIGVGVIVARYPMKRQQWKNVLGVVVSVVLLTVEAACLRRYGMVREEDMYLMLLPATYFLLCAALQMQTQKSTEAFRSMSMNIYFVHMIFKFVYRQLPGNAGENGMGLFLFTFVGTMVTAWVMHRIGQMRRK